MGLQVHAYSQPVQASYGLNSQRPEIIQVPNQVEIAKLTLASYKNLRPDYLYLNIDLGKYDSEEIRQEFCEVVRKSFPHAEAIELKWSRPIKVEKWLEQAKKIYQEFGNEIIVLANWNHDHPYIEESNALTDVLKESASTVLNGFDSSKTIYNITHQPSLLSILSEHFSVENRLGNEVNEIKTENGTLFVWPDMDHQAQGLFMCKPKYLIQMWSKILSFNHAIPEYVPRPDFPQVPIPVYKEIFAFGCIEYVAHYDGYTHNCPLAKFMRGVTFDGNKPKVLSENDDSSLTIMSNTFKRLYYQGISRFIKRNPNHQHIMIYVYHCATYFMQSHWLLVSGSLVSLKIIEPNDINIGKLQSGYGSIYESLINYFYTLVLEDYPYLTAAASTHD